LALHLVIGFNHSADSLAIHPNNNRGTETQQSTTDFDANGNLLTLNNIGTLNWHYNNTLNQLNKQDKNTTEYYVVFIIVWFVFAYLSLHEVVKQRIPR
jgi:hypothetical protein